MRTANVRVTQLLTATFLLLGWMALLQAEESDNTLDMYVHQTDDTYEWKIVSNQEVDDLRFIVVQLTSQTWLTTKQVNHLEWQHWLEFYIPNELASDVAFLFITGGSINSSMPNRPDSTLLQVAQTTRNVVVKLPQVPNQPLEFLRDGQGRSEDDLIAFSWVQFLETNDTSWIAQNAMVKSAVRAMDAATEVLASKEAGQISVEKFVVAGGSKRGWTTWLTAAMDSRAIAIIPLVFDALNTRPSMRHHFEAYGFWSASIGDYVNHGIMPKLQSKELDPLVSYVDPYEYRERLKVPKFIVNSAGDQFFLPDSSQFYWEGLSNPKYLRYIPNTDHSLDGSDAVESIAAFLSLVSHEKDIPNIEWSREDSNSIEVRTTHPPLQALLWSAHNATSRDFRLLPPDDESGMPRGPLYSKRVLSPSVDDGLVFHASVVPRDSGWTAWFVEFVFDVGLSVPLKLTTNVQVTPETLPFAGKDSKQDTYLTIHCTSMQQDSNVPKKVLEFLANNVEAPNANHAEHLGRSYFNWKQSKDIRVEGTAVANFLESVGYVDCRFQLESGKGPTLPPIDEQ